MSNLILGPVWKMRLKPSPKFVAVSLADQANDDGYCWPGINSISKRTGISTRTVQESIRYLESIRLISVVERPGKSNGYQFNMEFIRNAELFDGVDTAESESQGVRNSQGCESRRGASTAGRGATAAGEGCDSRTQTINNHQETSGGSAPARGRILVPEDWRPDAATVTRCKDAGYPEVTDGEITAFVAHNRAVCKTYPPNAIADAFVAWMHKAQRFNAPKPALQGGKPGSKFPDMPDFRIMPEPGLLNHASRLRVKTEGKNRDQLVVDLQRAWRRENGVPA